MIGIGADFGGPEQQGAPIDAAITKAMTIAEKVRDPNHDDGTEAWINPIFIVPGSVHTPDFEGFKLGHFSRKKKGLVVMISVPQSVADGEGIADFIAVSLREAVREAAYFFSEKGISFSSLKAEKIIIAIEDSLERASTP